VPTTPPRRTQPTARIAYRQAAPRRRGVRWWAVALLTVVTLILAAGGWAVYTTYRHIVSPLLATPGCQAGTGQQAVPLDTGQAAIASTIAGVAARYRLPREAITVAYATAMQESKMENLDYGDRDSVGVFQQRPSEGWGTTTQLEDPVYATTVFYNALVKIPGYAKMPVYQAAQEVQHSADGYAYQQYASTAASMARSFTGAQAHAVTCWYSPASHGPDATAAWRAMAATFGAPGQDGVLKGMTTSRSDKSVVFRVRPGAAWTVASWLVTHADSYGINNLRYGGYEWQASLSTTSWQRDPSPATGGIVAS
jgi:hypothetical protein